MKKTILGIFILMAAVYALHAVPVLAQAPPPPPPQPAGEKATEAFLKDAGFTVLNPAKGQDARLYIAMLVTVALSFTGFLFFLLMFYGGYLWLSAGGNDEQLKKSKAVLTRAVIGFAVVMAAFSVTVFISRLIISASLPEGYVPKENDTTLCTWIGVGCG